MKAITTPPKDLQAQRLRLHGLDVIEGRQGSTAFQKLVLTRPMPRPMPPMPRPTQRPSANPRRLPVKRQ